MKNNSSEPHDDHISSYFGHSKGQKLIPLLFNQYNGMLLALGEGVLTVIFSTMASCMLSFKDVVFLACFVQGLFASTFGLL